MLPKLTTLEKGMVGLILAVLIIFLFRECGHQQKEDDLISSVANYKDSAQHYILKVNGMEVEVAKNKSLVLESNNQVTSVLSSMNDTMAKLISQFKKIHSGTIINNNTYIGKDTIKLHGDSIPCDFKAFKVRRDSMYYHFVGTISKKYFSIDTLLIPNKMSIVIGKKKLGFLKGYEEQVSVINSNPLVTTTNIGNYMVLPKQKRFGIGVSAGYGITLNSSAINLSPYIGLSMNYNLIKF